MGVYGGMSAATDQTIGLEGLNVPGASGWSECVCMNHCVSTSGDRQ